MRTESTASEMSLPWERPRKVSEARALHLVLAWSLDEPDRLGEAIPIGDAVCVGRGGPLADDDGATDERISAEPASAQRFGSARELREALARCASAGRWTRADAAELWTVQRTALLGTWEAETVVRERVRAPHRSRTRSEAMGSA